MKLADPPFWTVQGEGHLTGQGMAFVRFSGCSVGCDACDTDYTARLRFTPEQITELVLREFPHEIHGRNRWVWLTGGEPTDRNLDPLLELFSDAGLSVALATAGVRPVKNPVDWLSVSPHTMELAQTWGNEVKIVPGLNGLDAWRWLEEWDSKLNFWLRFFQPLDGDPDSLGLCKELFQSYPHWGISMQTHKLMGLP
jgi:hypothetical protein